MRVVMFYQSLLSDWNHGNAHFLRGVVTELVARGHEVAVYEPRDSWSLTNLVAEYGWEPVESFRNAYPGLDSVRYDPASLDPGAATDGADLVLVHEWNEPELVRRLGEHRRRAGYRLLFHDTHHRAVTDPESMAAYDLRHYDGVLAFGEVLREIYLMRGWATDAWTWHEAADTRVFRPLEDIERTGDLVWVGNWGDEERTAELRQFLLGPVRALRLRARAHGVRYPFEALPVLAEHGIEYRGWLANYCVPDVFARFRCTVHIPRRPYVRALPGIPTIRPFEALACGIPLICSPWDDVEGLFTAGQDYLVAGDGQQMTEAIHEVLSDRSLARRLAVHGLSTIRARHTCAHRVDELLGICRDLGIDCGSPKSVAAPV